MKELYNHLHFFDVIGKGSRIDGQNAEILAWVTLISNCNLKMGDQFPHASLPLLQH